MRRSTEEFRAASAMFAGCWRYRDQVDGIETREMIAIFKNDSASWCGHLRFRCLRFAFVPS